MNKKLEDEVDPKIIKYFEDKTCLILEPSTSVRNTIRRLMKSLGLDNNRQTVVQNIAEAKGMILQDRPNFVISAFEINGKNSLELSDLHIQAYPNRMDAGFYVLSDNNSLSIASMILDLEIDAYYSQPFTFSTLQESFLKSLKFKVNPNKFWKTFEEGKELLHLDEMDKAEETFKSILSDNEESSIAYAYVGNIAESRNELDKAEEFFNKGIDLNPTSYNCLKGLSELCMKTKKYKKGYEVYHKMIENYPLNPSKIPDLTRLSIVNQKYEDILNYTEIFSGLEDKVEGIKVYISAGLAICGKFMLNNDDREKGMDALMEAAKLSDGKMEILKSVISTLMNAGAKKKAKQVLENCANDNTSENEFKVLELSIIFETGTPDKAFSLGTNLINRGIKEQGVYEIVIQSSIKLGRSNDKTEDIVFEAIKAFPDQKEHFNKFISK